MTLPAIHASQLTPLIGMLRDLGAPVSSLLESESISPDVLETQAGFIPAQRIFNLIERAGESQQIEDIGWRAGYGASLMSSGAWAVKACSAPTLRDALAELINGYPQVVPLVQMGVTENARTAWLWRRRLADLTRNPGQHAIEQFTLARFMKLIRLAAGEEWTPRRIRVETPVSYRSIPPQSWVDTEIEHHAPVFAIEMPLDLLDLPMPPVARHSTNRADDGLPSLPTLEAFLHDALCHDIDQRILTIERAAEIVITSRRTLRRQLSEEGIGWRTIRDRLLHERACSLLSKTDLPVGHIALDMGYSDSAHFTRAFERWQHESPRSYRDRSRADRLICA